jgi:hypothetical protein
VIDPAAVQDLMAKWWFNYDEGHFDVLRDLVTEDVHAVTRTDTGQTDYEEFVRSDTRGRDDMIAWQRQHRVDSPYPLRHNGTNIHIVENRGEQATFASYIFVTQIADGVSNLSTGIVRGVVRDETGTLRIAELDVTLDTMESRVFSEVRS